jgi:DNA-3-methyladenine glycosylase II
MTLVIPKYELQVAKPYRLDLTVSVLRRLSTNIVDVLTPDGHYCRILDISGQPVLVRVAPMSSGMLAVTLGGDVEGHQRALEIVRRVLGTDRTLTRFNRAAARIPWLRPLAIRMRGVKPPRYPTLWEACVNAVLFQQVSLVAASAILRRLILAVGSPVVCDGEIRLHTFPDVESVLGATDGVLHAAGLSAGKIATLRRVGAALAAGTLDERMLEACTSLEAAARLQTIKGIGPWTATVILLRGLGRLDVFPMNDSSVAANLAFVAGSMPPDVESVLAALGPQRGMLYYHLLLARLDLRREIGRASTYPIARPTRS